MFRKKYVVCTWSQSFLEWWPVKSFPFEWMANIYYWYMSKKYENTDVIFAIQIFEDPE